MMNRRPYTVLIIALAISAIASLVAAQKTSSKIAKPAVQSVGEESRYSTTLLHNADLTIRRLNIPPGAEAPIPASTHDYLIISIGTNSISAKGEGTSFDLALGPGDMQVLQGGWKHAVVNTGQGEAELFMIEPRQNIGPKLAICGLGSKPCTEEKFGETAEGTYNQNLQFETETTKLFRLSIDPGVVTHLHSDGLKHLIVAVTPFQGHNDDQKFSLKAGDMRWIPSSIVELGNDGKAEVRLLVLELKG